MFLIVFSYKRLLVWVLIVIYFLKIELIDKLINELLKFYSNLIIDYGNVSKNRKKNKKWREDKKNPYLIGLFKKKRSILIIISSITINLKVNGSKFFYI